MRFYKVLLSVLCVLMVSACTQTIDGIERDWKDARRWSKGKTPTALERSVGMVPTGYHGQNKRGVILKPPGMVQHAAAPHRQTQAPDGVVWNNLGDYEVYRSVSNQNVMADLLPEEFTENIYTPPKGVRYNNNVEVFSLDGHGSPTAGEAMFVVGGTGHSQAGAPYASSYGALVDQVFFAHGSARLTALEKQGLRDTAKGIKGNAVTVVGHASKRVDGVSDPVKRKMINFKMAQKRADAVTRELKKAGSSVGWVQTVSSGDNVQNPNPPPGMSQEAADRRTEIFVDGN